MPPKRGPHTKAGSLRCPTSQTVGSDASIGMPGICPSQATTPEVWDLTRPNERLTHRPTHWGWASSTAARPAVMSIKINSLDARPLLLLARNLRWTRCAACQVRQTFRPTGASLENASPGGVRWTIRLGNLVGLLLTPLCSLLAAKYSVGLPSSDPHLGPGSGRGNDGCADAGRGGDLFAHERLP